MTFPPPPPFANLPDAPIEIHAESPSISKDSKRPTAQTPHIQNKPKAELAMPLASNQQTRINAYPYVQTQTNANILLLLLALHQ
jgi:hypothetical protein